MEKRCCTHGTGSGSLLDLSLSHPSLLFNKTLLSSRVIFVGRGILSDMLVSDLNFSTQEGWTLFERFGQVLACSKSSTFTIKDYFIAVLDAVKGAL